MKKRWLRRLIYLVVVAGTAGFAFYQYKQQQKEEQEEEKKDLIFSSLDSTQVQSVSIKREDGNIRFFRQGEGWYMDSPVKDTADRDLIGDWLESLFSEKVRVIKEKGASWSEYGLDKNVKSIEITTTSDENLKLDISYYSAFDGHFYIKKGEKLLLGKTSWATLVNKKGNYFRSYKLLNVKGHPTYLRYSSKPFKAHLKWENHEWKWEEDSVFPLSHSDLESYWASLSNVSFEKQTYPDTEEFRQKFKLLKPAIELDMKFKKDKNWSVKISHEVDGKFYTLLSTRDYIFVLNKDQRDRILLTEKTIRDHRQPFQFEKDQVHFMELKGYGVDIQLKKEQEDWMLLRAEIQKEESKKVSKEKGNVEKSTNEEEKAKLVEDKIEKKLNKAELQNVFNRIKILSAKQYFGEKKSFIKTSYLILEDKEGKILLNMDLSDPFDSKDKKKVYVKSNLGTEVMALDFEDLKFVFSPSLLKTDKAEEKK